MSRTKPKLDETSWQRVFDLRCKSKRGWTLTAEELRFLEFAYRDDPNRYAALNNEVFNATLPFGARKR